jgi:hypothetical protein
VPERQGGEQARLAVLLRQHDDQLADPVEVVAEDLALESSIKRATLLVGKRSATAVELRAHGGTPL